MTQEDFERFVSQEPAVEAALTSAARAAQPTRTRSFGTPVELAAVAVLFPVVSYVVKHIGLPWLYEAKRYSELWRLKFHRWIDEQHRKAGFDPDQAEAVGQALRRELETTTDQAARAAWQRLADLLRKSPTDDPNPDT